MTLRSIHVEGLSGDAFGPFGEVLEGKDRPADFIGRSGSQGWVSRFATSGEIEVSANYVPHQGLSFYRLECHHRASQAFVPLSGPPSVLAVASPTDPGQGRIPEPSEIRGFLLDGTKGIILKPGTWHSLDRYPLRGPGSFFVVVNDAATARDLAMAASEEREPVLTSEINYRELAGVEFEFECEF